MGFFSKILEGLKKTKQAFQNKIKYIFTKNEIDANFYEELEAILLSSDVGHTATDRILEELKKQVKQKKLKNAEETKNVLKDIMVSLLEENELAPFT